MKKHISIILLSLAAMNAGAQGLFPEVLSQIEANSLELKAMQALREADVLDARTGLTPADPEVEYSYLWGKPEEIGNRQDISITQELDFPTAYVNRRRYADSKSQEIENEYLEKRMELLLQAQDLCVELICRNALYEVCRKQTENAQIIADAYKDLSRTGSANAIDSNKARMNLATMQDRLSRIALEREKLVAELKRMNGGMPVSLDSSSFPEVVLPASFQSLVDECEAASPSLAYYESLKKSADDNLRTVRSESMPKWSVGYTGEFVSGENFRGITVGLNIPLWENRNRIRQARAQAIAAVTGADDARADYLSDLEILYSEAVSLKQSVRAYFDAIDSASNSELLLKAWQGGQIGLLDYMQEMEYSFECSERMIETQRDLLLAAGRLQAFRL